MFTSHDVIRSFWSFPNRHQTKMKLVSDRFGIEYDDGDDIIYLWNYIK